MCDSTTDLVKRNAEVDVHKLCASRINENVLWMTVAQPDNESDDGARCGRSRVREAAFKPVFRHRKLLREEAPHHGLERNRNFLDTHYDACREG